MYKLNFETSIACAHNLKDSEQLTTKKCLDVHGHNYRIQVIIQTNKLKSGMVIDFGKLKAIINEFDHKSLNDFIDNPTTENLCFEIWKKINEQLPKLSILEVIIWESEKNYISYTL